jgi:predicted GH43/DUF377 family glycosyl hydrolase
MRRRRWARPALRWIGLFAATGLVAGGVWGQANRGAADTFVLGLKSSGGWTYPLTNPVIKAGDFRSKALWNDPCVLLVDGQYIMYMTTSTEVPFKAPVLPFRAVSRDARSWSLSPQTPLMTVEGTPYVSIETPSVVRFHGSYHMFFTGIYKTPEPAPMAIGHAVSDDGIHWIVTTQPVINATGNVNDWNGYLVDEPGAVVHNDQIYVYFSAVRARPSGEPPQLQTIGLATTMDGITFQPAVEVLAQSALYPPEKGFTGYSTPEAFELGGRLHLFYDVALFHRNGDPDWQQVALHHAVATSDSATEFVEDRAPMLTRDDFRWTSGEIFAPAALVDGQTLRLWFGGHVRRADFGPMIKRGFAGPELGIGYATRPAADLQK